MSVLLSSSTARLSAAVIRTSHVHADHNTFTLLPSVKICGFYLIYIIIFSTWSQASNRMLASIGGSNEYLQFMFWAEILKISGFLSENYQCWGVKFSIYSRLSLSRIPRDSLKHFEISVLRHIRFAELRKKLIWLTTFNKYMCYWTFEVRYIENIVEKRRNCSLGAISSLFHNIFYMLLVFHV